MTACKPAIKPTTALILGVMLHTVACHQLNPDASLMRPIALATYHDIPCMQLWDRSAATI